MVIVPLLMLAAYWFLLLSPKRDEASTRRADDGRQAGSSAPTTARQQLAQPSAPRSTSPPTTREIVRLGKAIPRSSTCRACSCSSTRPPPARASSSPGSRPASAAPPRAAPRPPRRRPSSPVERLHADARRRPARPRPRPARPPRAPTTPLPPRNQSNAAAEQPASTRRHPDLDLVRQRTAGGRRRPPRPRHRAAATSSSRSRHRVARARVRRRLLQPRELLPPHVKSFVQVADTRSSSTAAWSPIEGVKLRERHAALPQDQGGADGDRLPLARGAGRDRRRDAGGSRAGRPGHHARRAPRPTPTAPAAPTAAATPWRTNREDLPARSLDDLREKRLLARGHGAAPGPRRRPGRAVTAGRPGPAAPTRHGGARDG